MCLATEKTATLAKQICFRTKSINIAVIMLFSARKAAFFMTASPVFTRKKIFFVPSTSNKEATWIASREELIYINALDAGGMRKQGIDEKYHEHHSAEHQDDTFPAFARALRAIACRIHSAFLTFSRIQADGFDLLLGDFAYLEKCIGPKLSDQVIKFLHFRLAAALLQKGTACHHVLDLHSGKYPRSLGMSPNRFQ